jgi:uncharacterized membrane protein YbhN (UPF0104 family)
VVVVYALFRLPAALAHRLGWAELATNVVVPAGGISGLGIGAWVLRRQGLSPRRIARTSAAMFLLTSVPNFAAVAVVGGGLWLGVVPGPRAWWATLVPAIGAGATLAAAWALGRRPRGRLAFATPALREAGGHVRRGGLGLWGAVAYWGFDNAVLGVGLLAVDEHVPVGAILMGYLLGQLASLLPVPGGVGAAEGGLVGGLALFGVAVAPATAAVLVYRSVALWVPVLGGALAMPGLRGSP